LPAIEPQNLPRYLEVNPAVQKLSGSFSVAARAALAASREARRARSTTLRSNLCGLPMTAHRIGSSRNALAIEIWLSYGSSDARFTKSARAKIIAASI
jgi:hypothetical protein